MLPREEEPQIVVPMIDIFVAMPGASAREVEERVTRPMEKLLWEIPGVEYIYSTSSPGASMAVVRFFVGEDEEKAIVRLNQKMFANFDLIPPGASAPLIKPRSIDDVPILALTLWSKRYGDYELRRLAAQLHDTIKQVDQVSAVAIIGGQRRQVRVDLDEARLAGYHLSPADITGALSTANRRLPAASFSGSNREIVMEAGSFLASADDVRRVVVGVADSRPVFLGDVARIEDGGEEPSQYVRYASAGDPASWPAVTLAVSKRKGANAIGVAHRVLARVDAVRGSLLPSDESPACSRACSTGRTRGENVASTSALPTPAPLSNRKIPSACSTAWAYEGHHSTPRSARSSSGSRSSETRNGITRTVPRYLHAAPPGCLCASPTSAPCAIGP
jgi:multidrug efflux pump subunit AcrB